MNRAPRMAHERAVETRRFATTMLIVCAVLVLAALLIWWLSSGPSAEPLCHASQSVSESVGRCAP